MEKVFRQYVGKSSVNPDGTIKAVISTNTPDRYDEIVNPKGVRLDDYRKNPVVLFNHNSNIPPIGKNVQIAVYDNEIVAVTKFADTQLGKEIKSLYEGGFMNAFSIGFIPHKVDVDEQGRKVYNDWEMFEYSCVPIPANPEAIAMALKSIESPELKSMLTKYKDMQIENEKIKSLEETIASLNNSNEDLQIKYDEISNDLVKLAENAILVERALEEFETIKKEIEDLKNLLNGRIKNAENELLQKHIDEVIYNRLNKLFKRYK